MRSVVVTGGTRGLGLAVARQLVGEGYRVVAIARNRSAEFAAHEESSRGALQFIPFDLASIHGMSALVKQVHTGFGPIYGLVNNAALGTDGSLAMMPVSEIERVIRLNTIAPIVLSKYVVRRMIAGGGGHIVNVASITAFTGYSGLSVYG